MSEEHVDKKRKPEVNEISDDEEEVKKEEKIDLTCCCNECKECIQKRRDTIRDDIEEIKKELLALPYDSAIQHRVLHIFEKMRFYYLTEKCDCWKING